MLWRIQRGGWGDASPPARMPERRTSKLKISQICLLKTQEIYALKCFIFTSKCALPGLSREAYSTPPYPLARFKGRVMPIKARGEKRQREEMGGEGRREGWYNSLIGHCWDLCRESGLVVVVPDVTCYSRTWIHFSSSTWNVVDIYSSTWTWIYLIHCEYSVSINH